MLLRSAVRRAMVKMKVANTKFLFPLLDLPTELVALIFEHVTDHTDLQNLCLTCSKTQELAEPILYRGALMRSGYAVINYLSSLNKTSRRMNAVQHLELALNPDFAQDFDAVGELLSKTRNLRRLFFESPQCNAGRFEDEEEWEEMTRGILGPMFGVEEGWLGRLEELTIHMNGPDSPYWDIDHRGLKMFELPSLRYLRLSCVNILDDVAKLVDALPERRSTCLKTLELEECNVTHKGLHAILSLPKALETLQLGENCHNIQHFAEAVHSDANHLFQRDAEAAVRALSQHSQTLKNLTVITTNKYFQWPQYHESLSSARSWLYGGFADFHALESATLDGVCSEFEVALLSSKSPPNLKEIIYKGRARLGAQPQEDKILTTVPFLRAPSCSVPETLRTVKVILAYLKPIVEGAQPFNQDEISNAAKATEKMGCQLKVSYMESNNYFPPYLWGEPILTERPLFDGNDFDAKLMASYERSHTYRLWSFIED